ncbi:type II restriction endonuclease [Pseudomonas sp. B1-22]|uniref:type II restriction endonuclease n=1 Tax=Pseudomonas sp. B1-22 TaxID=3141456 RepID=UPI003D2C7887
MPIAATESTISLIEQILQKCSKIAIKKLSNNDRKWADGPEFGHQNGPYIPLELREGSFFPSLSNATSSAAHIYECRIQTCWVRTGEVKQSRLVNYSNKGKECHLTGVPKAEFAGIGPASWFLAGRHEDSTGVTYYCVVLDSADEEGSAYVETIFELDSAFEYSLFDTAHAIVPEVAPTGFIEELLQALTEGRMESLWAACAFPKTAELAAQAQTEFLRETGAADLNPFKLECPGNALMRISRDIEYHLFRQHSARHYSAKLLHMLSGGKTPPDLTTVVTELVTKYDEIYKEVMVSAGQRSKSRAGYSFEQHVQRMLADGGIPFQEQRFVGNQRPDFILPSLKLYRDPERERDDAFILSLKTLLRERWKQVLSENKASDLYLGTVDDGIAGDSVEEMRENGIYLVVPEQLKDSKYTEYERHENVITFRDFFRTELGKRRTIWIDKGLKVQFNDS